MIPANKKPLLDALIYRYFQRRLRRTFHAVYLRGNEHLCGLPADRPVLAYSNHPNWWDPILVLLVTRRARHKKIYGMMEEKQLRPYGFFTWLGAFSVDLENPRSAIASLRYAAQLLRQPENLLWLFPQGRLRSVYEPFTARPGLAFLAKRTPQAVLLPCAFRYEFFRDDRPVLLIEVGAPFPAAQHGRIEQAVQSLCDNLAEVARTQNLNRFTSLQSPALPINKKWQWLWLALRGRLREFDPHN